MKMVDTMDDQKVIIDKNGRNIILKTSDGYSVVDAFFEGGLVGSFHFDEREECNDNTYFLVTNMHLEMLPGFKRKGIGTAIINWVKESTDLAVTFGRDDVLQCEDGSHLTGDGPAFAEHIYENQRVINSSEPK